METLVYPTSDEAGRQALCMAPPGCCLRSAQVREPQREGENGAVRNKPPTLLFVIFLPLLVGSLASWIATAQKGLE